LAGILLKMGAYGFIRFSLQMTRGAFQQFALYVIVIAVVTALYGALVALPQTDIKRLVAYTSVNHMGYMMFVVAAATAGGAGTETPALDGATLQIISHGVVTGLLFLLVGALQDRTRTRDMSATSGELKTHTE